MFSFPISKYSFSVSTIPSVPVICESVQQNHESIQTNDSFANRTSQYVTEEQLKRKMRQFRSVFEDRPVDNVLMLRCLMLRLHIQVFENRENLGRSNREPNFQARLLFLIS